MAIASTPTLLSLDRWARIVGLNPLHFAGATAGNWFALSGHCDDVWRQHAWQSPEELVSREEVGFQIAKAEADIKAILGYSPAPEWEVRESHTWPGGLHRYPKQVALHYGKLLAPGVRAATPVVEGAEVIYSDADNDGWDELATVAVTTELTDPREIKLFFADQAGEPQWEIRPLRKVSIAGGVATITADAWLFIDPELWERYPNQNASLDPIDLSTTENYVGAVDVYRIYNDHTSAGASFLVSNAAALQGTWCPYCTVGTCPTCGATTQAGTFAAVSAQAPLVVPYPASYSDGAWRSEPWANCGVPTMVGFHYYAGAVDKRYELNKSLDPLSDFWADTIAWMAAARLPRGVCGCDNIRQRLENIQRDLTRSEENAAYARTDRMDIFSSAFGTRVGEVRAWQAVTRLTSDQVVAGGAL